EPALAAVLAGGCWTPVVHYASDGSSADWQAELLAADGSHCRIRHGGEQAELRWALCGRHNVDNALAALAAAHAVGVPLAAGVAALARCRGVARRQELRAEV